MNEFLPLVTSLSEFFADNPWFAVVSSVVTVASTVAAVTPTPKAGTFLGKLYKVVDFLAINIGKAKQK